MACPPSSDATGNDASWPNFLRAGTSVLYNGLCKMPRSLPKIRPERGKEWRTICRAQGRGGPAYWRLIFGVKVRSALRMQNQE
jgi:hypothetical protein